MGKIEGLKKRWEFVRVYSSGRSLANEIAVIYWFKNELPVTRVGFSVSKKVGNAVVRNRLRRLFREAFRLYADKVQPGVDIVFIVRRSAVGSNFHDIENAISRLITRAGLWTNFVKEH
jgi:ribonuclease P protein component